VKWQRRKPIYGFVVGFKSPFSLSESRYLFILYHDVIIKKMFTQMLVLVDTWDD
jgi:hypothetical protein